VNADDLNAFSRTTKTYRTTVLQDAVMSLAVKCVKWLLECGADPNYYGERDNHHGHPLCISYGRNVVDAHGRQRQSECVLLLLGAGAIPKTNEGYAKSRWILRAIYTDLNDDVIRAFVDIADGGIMSEPAFENNPLGWVYEYAVKSGK
jgi:hypothetical protein